ncbi:EsaB/YukD family protein [Cellulomonas dongxiuzhuiae]|uniref:EsaB/YukD family protein n=1 Tax=Cellulomonas dongxiuzhuiae TaxID=2819979 RepID=UPI001AAE6349|nr:EsaB/YukD family protein [Cellulomonas dongxiuzhuiae]MBO3089841.1 hypothetical protein [Cellulomonas dongxiuzhuiae]
MSGWTRLTVQGAARRAQVVVPDDEPVAGLLPDLLDLLAEDRTARAHPATLVTLLGEQIDPSLSLGEQAVAQGALLRVVRVDQAPPPPEVADVTDVVAATLGTRPDRWRPAWAQAVAAALAGVAGWVAGTTALGTAIDPVGVGAGALAAGVVAAGLARWRQAAGVVVGAAAAGGVVSAAPAVAGAWAPDVPGSTVLLALVGVGAVLALVAGAGTRRAAAAAGAGVGVLLAACPLLLVPVAGATGAAGATAVLGALVLGLLPGVAMSVSGLNGLDDRAVAGERPSRARVRRAVEDTYAALTWSTVATCAVTGVVGWVLVAQGDPWSAALAGAVALLVVLRVRVMPLVPQRVALWAAAAVVAVGWALAWVERAPGTVAMVASATALAAAATVTVHVTGPTAARLRRAASVVELLAAVATVPLLLAQLGVFSDLLDTF